MNWLTDGTSIVLGSTQEVNPADIKMTGFTKLNTTPSTLQSTEIQPTDSLLSVIQKLYLGITNNAHIKLISSGRMIGGTNSGFIKRPITRLCTRVRWIKIIP